MMVGGALRASAVSSARRAMASFLPVPDKLSEVVHLSLLQEQSAPDLTRIWTEYHQGEDSAANVLGSTIAADEAKLLFERGSGCPIFVLPLQREGGFMVMLSQFKGGTLNLTYLEDFRKQPNAAEPYMTAKLYTELVEEKGVVLARAHLDTDRLELAEAEQLLDAFMRVYTTAEMFEYVDKFNNAPAEFSFEEWSKFAIESGIGAAAPSE